VNYIELLGKSTFEKGGFRGIWKPPNGRNLWQTLIDRAIISISNHLNEFSHCRDIARP
jgi:hypothetical protein